MVKQKSCSVACAARLRQCGFARIPAGMRPLGQQMKEEAADELIDRQGHGFLLAVIAVVLIAELDLAVFDGEQTIIGNGHAVGIATQVIEYLLGSSKGLFGLSFAIA
jgi:hypothetical protein